MAAFDPNIEPVVKQEEIWLRWVAPERPYMKKSPKFMTVPVSIAALLGFVFIVAGEWMIIIVVAAVVFVIYSWNMTPAGEIEYRITSRGIRVGNNLYEWSEFTRWWMDEKWGQKLLMLEAPLQMSQRVVLVLGKTDEEMVEAMVERMVLKEKPEDTMLAKTSKWVAEKFPFEQRI